MDIRFLDSPPIQSNSAEWRLYYGGNTKPVAVVIPDPIWPNMYRIWANDWLSDYASLSRIKDAAEVIALRRAGHDRRLLKWKSCRCGARTRPVVRRPGNSDPGAAP